MFVSPGVLTEDQMMYAKSRYMPVRAGFSLGVMVAVRSRLERDGLFERVGSS